MTKSTDGTRVMSGPTSILPKTVQVAGQQSLIKIQPQPGQAQTTVQIQGTPSTTQVQAPPSPQQRVQILKQPDGKIQVKGLMPGQFAIFLFTPLIFITEKVQGLKLNRPCPNAVCYFTGQQLVQMPDGKLHVLNTAPQPGQQVIAAGQRLAVVNSGLVPKTPTIVKAIQGTSQSPATTGNVSTTTATAGPVAAKAAQGKAQPVLLRQGGQVLQNKIIVQNTPAGQQLLVSNANLAQQLASGKVTIATINGQQVLIRNPNPPATTNVPVPPLAPQVSPVLEEVAWFSSSRLNLKKEKDFLSFWSSDISLSSL